MQMPFPTVGPRPWRLGGLQSRMPNTLAREERLTLPGGRGSDLQDPTGMRARSGAEKIIFKVPPARRPGAAQRRRSSRSHRRAGRMLRREGLRRRLRTELTGEQPRGAL